MGMNCSVRYDVLGKAPDMAMFDLLNIVMEDVAGIEPTCPKTSYDTPSDCTDAPSLGQLNSVPVTCETWLESATKSGTKTSPIEFCDGLLSLTLYQLQYLWAPKVGVVYT